VFPLGFVIGLSLFVRQYLYVLTPAEQNRLRIILVGCLAGASPRLLAVVGGEGIIPYTAQFTAVLLPLFPVCLAVSVLKDDLSQIGKGFRVLLVLSVVIAGLVVIVLLTSIGVSLFSGEVRGLVGFAIPLSVALLLLYPLARWASTYISARFQSAPTERSVDLASISFEPIRPNPFIVGNPVRTPQMFFGRNHDFKFIRNTLRNQRQGSIILLTGERRTGKTSILYQILNGNLGEEFASVFLDMQALVVKNDTEFLGELASRIWEASPAGSSAGYGNYLQSNTPHLAFTNFMDSAVQQFAGLHLVLLVDEYELIEQRVNAGRLSSEIPGYLNSLLERYPRLSFVFTGSRSFEAKPLWSSLLGKAIYREISFLSWRDTEDLIRVPVQNHVGFREGVVGSVLRLTHGHPFYTQLFGQNMVDVINEREDAVVGHEVFRETVDRIIEHPPPQLLYWWSAFSTAEKLVLAAVATLLKTAHGFVTARRVTGFLESLPKGFHTEFDPASTRVHLEALKSRKVLDRDQTRYRFLMDLARRWVQTDHNVWNVLDESRNP
jgi:hypothetical protein